MRIILFTHAYTYNSTVCIQRGNPSEPILAMVCCLVSIRGSMMYETIFHFRVNQTESVLKNFLFRQVLQIRSLVHTHMSHVSDLRPWLGMKL